MHVCWCMCVGVCVWVCWCMCVGVCVCVCGCVCVWHAYVVFSKIALDLDGFSTCVLLY